MSIQNIDYELANSRGATVSPFGLNVLRMARAKYDFAVDGGAIGTITPKFEVNSVIPDNAIMLGATINATKACTSGGSATISVGWGGTGAATAGLLVLTAVATYSADAIIAGIPTIAVPVKKSYEGKITFSIAVAALTAGIIEVTVLYFVAQA